MDEPFKPRTNREILTDFTVRAEDLYPRTIACFYDERPLAALSMEGKSPADVLVTYRSDDRSIRERELADGVSARRSNAQEILTMRGLREGDVPTRAHLAVCDTEYDSRMTPAKEETRDTLEVHYGNIARRVAEICISKAAHEAGGLAMPNGSIIAEYRMGSLTVGTVFPLRKSAKPVLIAAETFATSAFESLTRSSADIAASSRVVSAALGFVISPTLPINGHEGKEFIVQYVQAMRAAADEVSKRIGRFEELHVPADRVAQLRETLELYRHAEARAKKKLSD